MKSFSTLRILLAAITIMTMVACAGGSKAGGKNCGCKAKAGLVGY